MHNDDHKLKPDQKAAIGIFCGFIAIAALFILVLASGCSPRRSAAVPTADSGVKKASAKIQAGADGLTVEQRNIKKRLETDNKPGSIKHLYVISAYSGQVLIYSTVKGKVTSGGKRLTNPVTLVQGDRGDWGGDFVMPRIQDDGTYGSSMPYLYWFDSQGRYHQHYVTGGQILHVSDQPLAVKQITINMELRAEENAGE